MKAIAQRGARDTMPRRACCSNVVDLHDDAVGLVVEGVARLAPALDEGDDALDVEAGLAVRVHRQAQRREAGEGLRLARRPAPRPATSAAPKSVTWAGAVSSSSW